MVLRVEAFIPCSLAEPDGYRAPSGNDELPYGPRVPAWARAEGGEAKRVPQFLHAPEKVEHGSGCCRKRARRSRVASTGRRAASTKREDASPETRALSPRTQDRSGVERIKCSLSGEACCVGEDQKGFARIRERLALNQCTMRWTQAGAREEASVIAENQATVRPIQSPVREGASAAAENHTTVRWIQVAEQASASYSTGNQIAGDWFDALNGVMRRRWGRIGPVCRRVESR